MRKLICIGAGPKSLAVALLASVLRRSGLASELEVLIIEKETVGANWKGTSGYTDGRFLLDTSPLKDLSFPYTSGYGAEIDHELGHFSFIEFLKATGEFPDWVSRGEVKITHRQFAHYLIWVANSIDVKTKFATLQRIIPRQGKVELRFSVSNCSEILVADGVLLTGPGAPKKVAIQDEAPGLIFDARNYWLHRHTFHGLRNGRVAVLGGGQSASTAALSLLMENPGLQVDIINRHGFLCMQSAGFHENAMCSIPSLDWLTLPIDERREILSRVNTGVVEASVKQALDRHQDLQLVRGSVHRISPIGDKVHLSFIDLENRSPLVYDRVVVAIGFDPVEQLRELLPANALRPGWFTDLAANQNVDKYFRLPEIGCNVHVPSLGGLQHGVGFTLLSCLGLVARRIVSTYVPLTADSTLAVDTVLC
jgi:mycobactin lysine-N-oxygenase